jgi:hypothetical protein
VFALVHPFPLEESFGFRFGGKNETQERNFSFQNGSASFRLPRREKRLKGKSPEVFRGRRFKWRESRQSLGRKPFKPQTALLRWSRAVGPSGCPATAGSAHASVRLVTERVFAKLPEARRRAWSGMLPCGRTHRRNKRASLGPAPSSPRATSAKGQLAGARGQRIAFSAALLVRSPPRARCSVLAQDGFFATRPVLHSYRYKASFKYHTLTLWPIWPNQ